jgi:hypothetical protein
MTVGSKNNEKIVCELVLTRQDLFQMLETIETEIEN